MEIHLVCSLMPDEEDRLAPSVLEAIWSALAGLSVSYSLRVTTDIGNAIHQSHGASHADHANGMTAEFTRVESPSASSTIVCRRGGTETSLGSDWQDFCWSRTNEDWIAEGRGTD
jgi:hypothetical protein